MQCPLGIWVMLDVRLLCALLEHDKSLNDKGLCLECLLYPQMITLKFWDSLGGTENESIALDCVQGKYY